MVAYNCQEEILPCSCVPGIGSLGQFAVRNDRRFVGTEKGHGQKTPDRGYLLLATY
jgi:hypothetical protein